IVAQKTADKNSNKFILSHFVYRYAALMLVYGCIWWLAPGLSLCLFIFFTAFHFGITDLHYFGKDNKLISFLLGLNLTAWLLLPHQTDLINWLQLILPKTDPVFVLINFLFKINPFVFIAATGFISFPVKRKRVEWVLFMLLLVLSNQLGLIGGFAFYFSGWHGYQAFKDIRNYINSGNSMIQLWKKAIPFTLLSMLGLVAVYAITPGSVWQNLGAPALIILISLLTLPHMQVMQEVYNKE
ncbi:MAG TPA: Brp/Blh family beta-carotene 15,15'-dioxygenase, partial [Sediminibacterium sp.]|nr:Brp/Blh family beta-carotene 15,15'-dioxygenase [Sediminibacterium sp.]